MAEKRSSSTTTRKRSGASRNTNGRKTSGSAGRSATKRSSGRASASRASTSSRDYGRTSNYAAKRRRKEEHDEMKRDILLVLLFAGMVFLFLSNLGLFDKVGHLCKTIMFGAVGAAAYVLPLGIFALVLYGMMSNDDDDATARMICVGIMYLVIAIICDLMSGAVDAETSLDLAGIYARCTEHSNGGGIIGGLFAWLFMHTIGLVGTILVLIVIAVICLVIITGKPLLRLMQDQAADARDRARYRREAEAAYRAEHPEEYEGFLPDEEDDELTDEDIAEYRERQEEIARAQREERAERLRDEARRDVERRHETRNQVYKTFKGIVGDTNLYNDPYVRQMSEEAAAREAAMAVEEDDLLDDDAMMDDGAANSMDPGSTLVPPTFTNTPVNIPYEEQPYAEELPEESSPRASLDVAAASAEESVSQETTTCEDEEQPVTHGVLGWIQSRAGMHKENAPAQAATNAVENQDRTTENVSEVAPGAYAAQQLLKNQRPGTDGIQLAVVSPVTEDDDDIDNALTTDRDAVRESMRQAIPIHRESNNLHEINALEFQGSYAALARGTVQNADDEEDLTSRIIREGMAELNRTENPQQDDSNYGGSAQHAARDAFRRSTAFTEIQDAYRQPAETNVPVANVEAMNDRDNNVAYALTSEPLQVSENTDLQLAIPAADTVAPETADSFNTEEELDPYSVADIDPRATDDSSANVVDPIIDVNDIDLDAEDESHDAVDAAQDLAAENKTTFREISGKDTTPTIDTASVQQVVPAPVPEMITAQQRGVRPPMQEMTTPVGSGSAMAAAHAKVAQIHTENNVAAQAAASMQNPAATAQPMQAAPVKARREYVYPPLNLLTEGNPSRDSGSDEELRHTAEVLETTLHTFNVNCRITDISQGPAVTRYELLPEQGVKVSKVVGLSDDIKLALAATDIRIEAPIPGKSAIGIEVPNKVTSTVSLRDILAHPNFRDHKSKLAIGIGKDISGQIVVSDLAKMPHVLIAGATGSGKSVCINTIIMSILYHATPEEVKLLMIDPKVVELSVYNGIPHLLYPVVTNPQQAATLLNWAVAEMESRYRKFADARVRDMKGYNQLVQQHLDRGEMTDADGNAYRVMPRIVVIVDELADLMMVAKNDVETAICRLAQLARAAGIHLIIATQRPSVDVITGLIKANMPSRIAFAVSSGVDSRTILDMNGAEKLLGKGDMLFFPQGLPKPARIQGAFVTDDEVSDVVEFIREQDPADTEEESRMRQQMENLGSTGQIGSTDSKAQDSANDIDDYFYRAGKFIIEKDNASIGLLQRGFRIGFNRAARLMDQLCDAGVVAESEGTKSRRILMTEAEFEVYCQENDIR